MELVLPIVLEGDRVRLEPLHSRHAPDLFIAAQDPEIWHWLPISVPPDVATIAGWVEATLAEASNGSIVPFAIVERASDRAIGSSRYMDIQQADGGLEIGWTWLSSAFWRTPINTECKILLLQHAFEQLGAIRVQLKTDLRNVRSQQAIARLGAVREGVLREHRIVKDGYRRSSVYFSILETEWPGVKARLAGMLARQDAPAGS